MIAAQMSLCADRRSRVLSVVGVVALLAFLTISTQAAEGAYPGKNGKIAFFDQGDTWVMNSDGTGRTNLNPGPEGGGAPAWSPDGTEIAFSRPEGILVMDADGGNRHQITNEGFSPSWSPDGNRIAYNGGGVIRIVNADGTNRTTLQVEQNDDDFEITTGPVWSPDGSEILVGILNCTFHCVGYYVLSVMADGSGYDVIDDGGPIDWSPDGNEVLYQFDLPGEPPLYRMVRHSGVRQLVSEDGSFGGTWSPDGTKIALAGEHPSGRGEISVVNPDGTNPTVLGLGAAPDWQPIPINSYPRPKSATPFKVSLVPAYTQCTAPNRTHGPSLGSGSCSSPTQASDELTLGTFDANGKPVRAKGAVEYTALVGDVRITVELNDVYEKPALSDYSGELRVRTGLRITDKLNTPHPGGPGAATVSDTTHGATVPCTTTADPNAGSNCNLLTSANTLVPGTVTAGKRAVWGLGQVQVDDGGADGDADTAGDNTLFMVQGVFVP